MEIGLLGPMSATVDGRSMLPSASKPRQVLALLSLHPRRVVQTEVLIEELWGAAPPRSVLTTLQTYVLQLRRGLSEVLPLDGPPAKDVLVTSRGGYLLTIDHADTEVGRFDDFFTRGQRAFRAGDHVAASRLLRQALDLWRGPVVADARHGRTLEIESARLEADRLSARELRISAELRLGGHLALLGELTALAGTYPLHERLHGQLMLALHRAGRTADALQAFHRLRRTLIEELGLEPTRHIRQLHQALLSPDPAPIARGGVLEEAVLIG
ncbi:MULTISPECIES: BTAD domain-containing putative transcriptional regulator [unclassified Streptomyces]|uniref:AfsR/SARP family transcriptional regulator n=1 Tax=unclassified Streptomyces TaxID=2593676 RepID=UPI003792C19B